MNDRTKIATDFMLKFIEMNQLIFDPNEPEEEEDHDEELVNRAVKLADMLLARLEQDVTNKNCNCLSKILENKDNSSKHPLDILLAKKNLDRRALARISGVSYDSLTSYVIGRRHITLKNTMKLCYALDCSPKELAEAFGYTQNDNP
ncbi:helix-turn-helix domain-containing protein [Gloeothece verrucosa]|uniref:Transcriptional regulator, XRE family n=1 Tax=Gloeothece verrucosa (strain PCC 7822) TaxID=497965 RepID=E0UAG1_GLOV7|nr:helix-turn-helix transcriptional regulator [Gloeothece verrucosa]ADN12702.1 transcriptional regulator, XRE family [Gloeothece verrucosa PCC 7822]